MTENGHNPFRGEVGRNIDLDIDDEASRIQFEQVLHSLFEGIYNRSEPDINDRPDWSKYFVKVKVTVVVQCVRESTSNVR